MSTYGSNKAGPRRGCAGWGRRRQAAGGARRSSGIFSLFIESCVCVSVCLCRCAHLYQLLLCWSAVTATQDPETHIYTCSDSLLLSASKSAVLCTWRLGFTSGTLHWKPQLRLKTYFNKTARKLNYTHSCAMPSKSLSRTGKRWTLSQRAQKLAWKRKIYHSVSLPHSSQSTIGCAKLKQR